MASQNFTFPPPPPPPPVASLPSYPSQSNNGIDFPRGGSRGRGRGRGRGHSENFGGQRGGNRGGYGQPAQQYANYGYSTPSTNNYTPQTYQHSSNNGYPLPNFPPMQGIQQQHMGQWQGGLGQPNYSPQQGAQQYLYQQGANRPAFIQGPNISVNPAYASNQQAVSLPPIPMGPPIRLGFDTAEAFIPPTPGQSNHQYPPASSTTNPPARFSHNFLGNRGRGQKRAHNEAFPHSKQATPASTTTPAVPSFGLPLPISTSTISQSAKKPKKKKRNHNQLGLTPKMEEHESSDDEDDVDEEAKLSSAVGASGQSGISFSYKGRLSKLNSASEIAAWIQERKKLFPTKARAEETAKRRAEGQKKMEEDKRKKQELAQAKREDEKRERQEIAKKRRQEAKAAAAANSATNSATGTKDQEGASTSTSKTKKHQKKKEGAKTATGKSDDNSSNKTISEAEKVQKKLEKAQKLVAKMEAKKKALEQARAGPAVEDSQYISSLLDHATGPLTPESGLAVPQENLTVPSIKAPPLASQPTHDVGTDTGTEFLSASDSEETSSSGSSDSSDSDASDDSSSSGSAPDEAPCRSKQPIRVPPPKRKNPKQQGICREFLRSGRCRRGQKCYYRHELPERGAGAAQRDAGNRRNGRKQPQERGRVTLYQRLIARQEEEEREENSTARAVPVGDGAEGTPKPE